MVAEVNNTMVGNRNHHCSIDTTLGIVELPASDPVEDKEGEGHNCSAPPANDVHLQEGFHTHNVPFKTNSHITPFVIAASLSFHSIFEGLALGLQGTLEGLISLLIGVAIHKCAEAFAMGISFIKSDTPKFSNSISLVSHSLQGCTGSPCWVCLPQWFLLVWLSE